jgi:hypothetical protein
MEGISVKARTLGNGCYKKLCLGKICFPWGDLAF